MDTNLHTQKVVSCPVERHLICIFRGVVLLPGADPNRAQQLLRLEGQTVARNNHHHILAHPLGTQQRGQDANIAQEYAL